MNQAAANSGDRLPSLWRGWAAVWAVAFAATLPLLVAYLLFIWRFEHYRYFPFALLLSGYLFWQRWDRRVLAPGGALGGAVFAGSLLLLLVAGLLYSPWLGAVAFVSLAGLFLCIHRSPSGSRLILVWLPLLMLLRLPLNYDQQIVVGLQRVTTTISSYLLDLMRIPHDTMGNVIQLPDRELLVAEACSGIQSAFTLCFVAIAVVAWKRRSLIVVPFMVGTALLWALIANVARVTAIAVAATMHIDLSTGWQHELLGYGVLLIAIGLVISTDRLLRTVFHPIGSVRSAESPNPLIRVWDRCLDGPRANAYLSPYAAPAVATASSGTGTNLADASMAGSEAAGPDEAKNPNQFLRSRRGLVIVGSVVLVALIANVPVAFWSATAEARPSLGDAELFFLSPPDLLAALEGEAEFVDHQVVRDGDDPRLGAHADLWQVRHPKFRGELILSQSYPEWHPLNLCYKLRQWQETSRYCTHVRSDDAETRQVAVSTFRDGDGLYGYLLYTGFLESGEIVDPPGEGLLQAAVQRCSRLFDRNTASMSDYQNHAMLQLWIPTQQKLPDSALSEAIETFGRARDRFSEEMKEAAGES